MFFFFWQMSRYLTFGVPLLPKDDNWKNCILLLENTSNLNKMRHFNMSKSWKSTLIIAFFWICISEFSELNSEFLKIALIWILKCSSFLMCSMWWIIMIYFLMLCKPCIPRINMSWLWPMFLSVHCWIQNTTFFEN